MLGEEVVKICEYDIEASKGYSYDAYSNYEGSYIFIHENTGYYCFSDYKDDSTSEKKYKCYNSLTEDDLDISSNNNFINRFKEVIKDVFDPVK